MLSLFLRPLFVLFALLTSTFPLSPTAGTDFPVLEVGFCLKNDSTPDDCQAVYAIKSGSILHFGDLRPNTLFYSDGENGPMMASCTASEPLRWILQTGKDTPAQLVESSFTEPSKRECCATYNYRIYFPRPVNGSIRCESHENSTRAAEVYIVKNSTERSYYDPDYMFLPFLVKPPKDSEYKDGSSSMVVPCVLMAFPSAMTNYSHLSITVAPRHKMLQTEVSSECIDCFPGPAIHPARYCMNCTNFALSDGYASESETESEGEIISKGEASLLSRSSLPTGDFTRCVTDGECYERAIIAESTVDKMSFACPNPDHILTCTDVYNSVSDHPPSCEVPEVLEQNFRKIENCMMREYGTTLTGLEYDPRIGFRLKTDADYDDVVFKCPTVGRKWSSVYLLPYSDNAVLRRSRVRPQLNYSSDETESKLTCSLRGSFQHTDKLDLILIECFPLTDCELKLRLGRGYIMAPQSNETLQISSSTQIKTGAVVRVLIPKGVVHGVVICGFPHSPQPHGVNFDNEVGYLFTGPDHKPYLFRRDAKGKDALNASALISLKLGSKYGGIGTILKVKCTMSTFLLFPELKLTIHVLNGRKAAKAHEPFRFDTQKGDFTLEHTWYFDVPENFTRATCTAPFRNSTKWLSVSISLDEILHSDDASFPTFWIVATVAGLLLLLGSTVCVVWANAKYRRAKEIRKLTREEITEFFHGNKDTKVEVSDGIVDVNSIGFPAKYHVAEEELTLDLSEKLGEGEFGYCVKGEYRGNTVAVKAAKDTADIATFKDFLREVKIMAYIGGHENIVEFVGAQVSNISQRMCKAVLELSPYGDLLSYVRGISKNKINVHDAYSTEEEPSVSYVIGNGQYLELDRLEKPLDFHHLCYFCEQIASGMEFLAEKRVIHGDLAARNVLVFDDFRVKLTDFGLSRKLYAAENYTKKQATPLPWRWMAIESLKYMEFSTMSDVWSFGVTAWEVFTLGQVPHSGFNWTYDFEEQLENGLRLRKPEGVPDNVYQFMLTLWEITPTARPSFSTAKSFFKSVRVGDEAGSSIELSNNFIPLGVDPLRLALGLMGQHEIL